MGANVGTSRVSNFDCDGADSCDESDTGVKIYGGYKFGSGFGVEGFYADLGEAKASGEIEGIPLSMKLKSRAIGVAATYTADLGASFQFAGRVGFASVKTELDATLDSESGSIDESNTKPWIGLSLGYKFTPNVSAQLAWDRTQGEIEGEKATYNLFTVGVRYDF